MSVVYGGRNDPPERRLRDATSLLSKGKKAISDNVTKVTKKLAELETARISADAGVDRIVERVAAASSDRAVGETTGKIDSRLATDLSRNVSTIAQYRMVAEKQEQELLEAIANAKADGELLAKMAAEFEQESPFQDLESAEAIAAKAEESGKTSDQVWKRVDELSKSANLDATSIQANLKDTNVKADYIRKKVGSCARGSCAPPYPPSLCSHDAFP